MRGIVAGYTNREIARNLGLSEQLGEERALDGLPEVPGRSRLELAIFALNHRAR